MKDDENDERVALDAMGYRLTLRREASVEKETKNEEG